jgi:hypothetical protein
MGMSTASLLIFTGVIAALVTAAFHNPRDHSCYRPEPPSTIAHAVHKQII